MIEARHTWRGKFICNVFSKHLMMKKFKRVFIEGDVWDRELPVLLVANHFCWWDGFIQYYLNEKTFKRKFHVMMLEEQLKKFKVLNGCGAYSIKPNSKGILDSLNYTTSLLEDNNNVVILFPQGKIESIHSEYIHFKKGVKYIFKRLTNNVQVVFNVNLIDYGSEDIPSLYIFYKEFFHDFDVGEMERDFNFFYRNCKKRMVIK